MSFYTYLILFLFLFSGCSPQDNRQRIAIIDTGVDMRKVDSGLLCDNKVYNFTDEISHDFIGHGVHTFNIAAGLIDRDISCIMAIKTMVRSDVVQSTRNYLLALRYLRKKKIQTLILPIEDASYYYEEKEILKEMSKKVMIFVAAGNAGKLLTPSQCDVYPACFGLEFSNSHFYVVSAHGYNLNQGDFIHYYDDPKYLGVAGTSYAVVRAAIKKHNKIMRGF